MKLHDPKTFVSEFFSVANATPPRGSGPKDDTRWFGLRMQELARKANYYCQSKESKRSGEWMCVDHVFVRENKYDSFPVIAVEHENGDMCDSSKGLGLEVPDGAAKGAYIEWALWKVFAIRTRLGVLVAYPWETDGGDVLHVLAKMADGFYMDYGHLPPVLLLLGWWEHPRNANWASAEFLYKPFVLEAWKRGAELVPLKM